MSTGTIPTDSLTGFQRDLLTAIARSDEQHGLGIKHWIETQYGEEVNHGRLYPNLDELVTRGLVTKGELDDRTNSYQLTERGAAVRQQLSQFHAGE